MSIPEPHHVDVARDADVEPLIRATRAELAQRTLELRTARHEADQLEVGLAHDGHDDARDLLRRSLEEFVESRRAELEAALDRELVRAAAATAPAEEESASDAATSAPEPVPPRRLQAVPDPSAFEDPAEEPDEPGKGEAGPAGASDVVTDDDATDDATTDDATTDDDDGATDDDVDGETGPVGHASAMSDPPPRPAQVPDPPATDSSATTPGFEATAVPDPALLRELVSAAVTAAVSQASALMGGSAKHRSWTPPPQELTTTYPVVAGHRPARRPFWRQLLHADVLLPLVLILIVFVVLLAWVG